MDVGTIVVSITGALLSSAGVAATVQALARRRVTNAEAAGALTDSAIELLQATKTEARADIAAMRVDLTEARRETSEAKRDAAEARRQVKAVRNEAEILVGYLRRIVGLIHDPTMTLERLRLVVGPEPPNGGLGPIRQSYDDPAL